MALHAAENPTFEVASVKTSPPVPPTGGVYFGPASGGPGTKFPTRITWSYARFIDLMMAAYDVKAYQVTGPAWMMTERYDVIAKLPDGATREQLKGMWQSLLADRFGLAVHLEPKEFKVEELTIAKGGTKLKQSAVEDADSDGPPRMGGNGELAGPGLVVMINPSIAVAVAKAQPLSKLTAMIGNQIGTPVVDKTGLAGKYDFRIEFRPNLPPPLAGAANVGPNGPNPNESGPDLSQAVQQQLGLRLMPGKATLDVVIVDRVQKSPAAN